MSSMAPKLDSAILDTLKLDATCTKITAHGGSGFAATFKISTEVSGQQLNYFVKTGSGTSAEIMFRGEHASLNAIHNAVPNFCPKSYGHGQMADPDRYFLATDFLDLGCDVEGGSGQSLAAKLAKLHTTQAPIPKGYSVPMFGFSETTCCGDTAQENSWKPTWTTFYAENRLRAILRVSVERNGVDQKLTEAVEKMAGKVVPRLVGAVKGIKPVVIHGDLWSGNHSRGQIAGKGGTEEVVYDPSVVYGHSEYELGIMKMFGGFGGSFWKEYEQLVPKQEPREEWDDRILMYELYHHLNHFAIFGGGYRGSAMSIMQRLLAKYG